jgi:hypothetical protein
MAILFDAYWQVGIGLGDAMTKRGDEIANAVTLLEALLDDAKEPKTDAEVQMFVKFWTAYTICKADHSARLLTSVNKSGGSNEEQR